MVGHAALFPGLSLAPVLDGAALGSDLLEKEGPAAQAPKVPPSDWAWRSPLCTWQAAPSPWQGAGQVPRRPASSRPVLSQDLGLSSYKPRRPSGRAVSSGVSF